MSQVEPFYFGPERRLFGAFHPPGQPSPRPAAVVLCQPVGHEYVRAHRAFRNLAIDLARQGFAVLRFDYTGCGDSAGDTTDVRLGTWVDDVGAAIEEVKQRSGAGRVCLAGLRLGAALASVCATRRRDVAGVVLWDPVVSGGAYLRDLAQLDASWAAGRGGTDAGGPADGDEAWLLGFVMPDAIREDIAAMNLATLDARHFPKLFVLASDGRYLDLGWAQGVRALYGPDSLAVIPPANDWERPESVHTALVAHPLVQAVARAVGAAAG